MTVSDLVRLKVNLTTINQELRLNWSNKRDGCQIKLLLAVIADIRLVRKRLADDTYSLLEL
jgi:hypothetical protein